MKIRKLQRITLYIFFFSINFEVWDPFNTGGNFSIAKLTGYLYLLSIVPQLSYFIQARNIKQFVRPLLIFFGLLTLVNILNFNDIYPKFLDFSILQNILLVIFLINHERKDRGVLMLAMLAFALGSITLATLYSFGIGVSYDGNRASIFQDNVNNIGIRMAISLIVLGVFFVQSKSKLKGWKYLLLIGIPFMLRLMADTASRVSFISFAVMFITGLFLYKTKRTYNKIFVLIGGAILAYVSWQYIASSNILIDRLIKTYRDQDLADRNIIWAAAWVFIKEHPFFGAGQTGYGLFANKVFGVYESPHNVILEVLCYTGIIGLIIYLTFVYNLIKTSYRKYKNKGNFLPLLLLIPVFGLMLSGQLLVVKIGWIIFALNASQGLPDISVRQEKRLDILNYENSLCN